MMTITNLDIYASLIKSIDAQFSTDKPKCVRSHDTFKSIGIDSMDMLCIICDLEKEYDVDIPEDAISIDSTIGKAADIIFALTLNS